MKVNDFIGKCFDVEAKPTLYKLGTFMNKYSDKYLLCDCSGLIKGILWGYPEKGEYMGNGVPDINADTMINNCSKKSTNFYHLPKGAVVHMKGHIGVHVGDGVCIEASPKWEDGIQKTFINGSGYSNTQKLHSRTWTDWGLFKYIDYSNGGDNEPYNPVSFKGWVFNAPNGLRVRSQPNTSSTILRKLSNGTELTILETSGNWGNIGDGWVCLTYVTKQNNNISSSVYRTGRYTVTASALIVRRGAGTNYRRLKDSQLTKNGRANSNGNGALLKGTHIDVYEVSGNWGHIPSGWVCLDYCRYGN